MRKNLLNGFFLSIVLSACSGVTPHIIVVCEGNSTGNDTIKWETKPAIEGEVKVYASTDPDKAPETVPVATAPIVNQCLLVKNNDTLNRYYYTLLFNDKYRVKVSSRNVIVPGTQNFRDLGGYSVYSCHKRVRWGMLYRSAQIDFGQNSTADKLRHIGIRTVIDLRDSSELPASPALTSQQGLRRINIPIRSGDLHSILDGIDKRRIQSDTVCRIVERLNRQIVANHAPQFRQLFDVLLDRRNYPAVIHCTSGKGRTGIASALVLAALGVDEESILYDYDLSNRYFDIPTASSYAYQLPAASQEALTTMYSAREAFLNAAKDEIERNYGSVNEYLRKAIGLTGDELKELRDILLVKDDR